jgi:hypothetical protein
MFRFTIRDVLWLMAIVGLAVGWVIDHRRLDERLTKAPQWEKCAGALERLIVDEGYSVVWRWDYADVQINGSNPSQFRSIDVTDPRVKTPGYNR